MAALHPPSSGLRQTGCDFFPEKKNTGQRLVRQVIARSQVDSVSGRGKRPAERIRKRVEAMPMFMGISQRQHRPAGGVARSDLDGAFKSLPRFQMIGRRQPLVVTEKTHQGFIRRPVRRVRAAHGLTDQGRQNAILIGAGGHDTRDEVVLNFENPVR
jgi:hypothetical protein